MGGRQNRSPEAAFNFLATLDWVYWKDDVRVRRGHQIGNIDTDISKIRWDVYKATGQYWGKKVLADFIREQVVPKLAKPLDGIVLIERPRYANVGGKTGVWFIVRNENHTKGVSLLLYFVPEGAPPGTIEVFEGEESWPKGVHYHWRWSEFLPAPDPSGTINDLMDFWAEAAFVSALGWETTLAMFLPAFLGQGVAGFILVGKCGFQQEEMIKWSYISVRGRKMPIYIGKTPYDLLVPYWATDLVFICSTNKRVVPKLTHVVKAAVTGQTIQERLSPRSKPKNFTLQAPVFICSGGLRVPAEMARVCLEIPTLSERSYQPFARKLPNRQKVMNGAFLFFQQASQLPEPTRVLDRYPNFPYRQWLSWAYRYAELLGVTDKLLSVVEKFGEVPKGIKLYKPRCGCR